MIAFKEEFIRRYLEKLIHKVRQELEDKLPDQGYFAEMVDKSDEILRKINKPK